MAHSVRGVGCGVQFCLMAPGCWSAAAAALLAGEGVLAALPGCRRFVGRVRAHGQEPPLHRLTQSALTAASPGAASPWLRPRSSQGNQGGFLKEWLQSHLQAAKEIGKPLLVSGPREGH